MTRVLQIIQGQGFEFVRQARLIDDADLILLWIVPDTLVMLAINVQFRWTLLTELNHPFIAAVDWQLRTRGFRQGGSRQQTDSHCHIRRGYLRF